VSPSKHNNRRRKDPSREPPTIDLKATVVDEGRKPAAPAQDAARADDGHRSSAATSADATPVTDEGGTVLAATSSDATRVMDEGGIASTSASARDGDSVQAVDAGSTPPASDESLSGGGSAIPVSTGDFSAPSEGSVATADARSAAIDVRSPFVTSLDAPQTVDEASTPAATESADPRMSGGGAAQAMDDGRLPQPSSDAPEAAGLSDGRMLGNEAAGLVGGPMPRHDAGAPGPDTLSDGTAVADEGPASAGAGATGSRAGEGRASAYGSDRDAADPTVPVADEDLARSSRGSCRRSRAAARHRCRSVALRASARWRARASSAASSERA
jgi:hypothetical protein